MRALRLENGFECLPDLLLVLRRGRPAVVGARRRDAGLVDEHEGHLLKHGESLVARFVVAPVKDESARAGGALVDAVDDDVAVARRPALSLHVDPVDEKHAHEIGFGEVVAGERVGSSHRVDPLGRVPPRLAVARDVADRPAECAVHELGACGNPAVDVRASEVAAFEPRLPGPDAMEVRAVEPALPEDALPSTRDELLQTLIDQLSAALAALDDANICRETP